MNKQKIINDPVHGFITIGSSLAYEVLSHPFFQRLRGIKQLGATNLVYPGACHSRFQHSLGAMHLMAQAIVALRHKGHSVSPEEAEAAECAMLLHDIGHSPFSHALECRVVGNVGHEVLSMAMMEQLNRELDGRLTMAIDVFANRYPRRFLHQLVSSQLDVDRLDYLRRDSFFSGVAEGAIGVERIIKMLDLHHDEVVVESKGIHSVEKFLIARRLMYWQVYLHKTVIAGEQLLSSILRRAKQLAREQVPLFGSEVLLFFLEHSLSAAEVAQKENIYRFALLSDADLECAIKVWSTHPDKVLSQLCTMFVTRSLPKVEIASEAFSLERMERELQRVMALYGITQEEASLFVMSSTLSNSAYAPSGNPIKILFANGDTKNIYEVSDLLNASAFRENTIKYFLAYPKKEL